MAYSGWKVGSLPCYESHPAYGHPQQARHDQWYASDWPWPAGDGPKALWSSGGFPSGVNGGGFPTRGTWPFDVPTRVNRQRACRPMDHELNATQTQGLSDLSCIVSSTGSPVAEGGYRMDPVGWPGWAVLPRPGAQVLAETSGHRVAHSVQAGPGTATLGNRPQVPQQRNSARAVTRTKRLETAHCTGPQIVQRFQFSIWIRWGIGCKVQGRVGVRPSIEYSHSFTCSCLLPIG